MLLGLSTDSQSFYKVNYTFMTNHEFFTKNWAILEPEEIEITVITYTDTEIVSEEERWEYLKNFGTRRL